MNPIYLLGRVHFIGEQLKIWLSRKDVKLLNKAKSIMLTYREYDFEELHLMNSIRQSMIVSKSQFIKIIQLTEKMNEFLYLKGYYDISIQMSELNSRLNRAVDKNEL